MNGADFVWFLSLGVVTAAVHASLPNHWLPFVAAARHYKWTDAQLLRFTLLVGAAHATTTIGLAVLAGLLGEGTTHFLHENSMKVAGVVLLAVGLIFFLSPRLYGHRHIHHPECEHCRDGSQIVTLVGLFVALALSPCEGLLPIFFAAAVKIGWLKALSVALTSGILTVILMMSFALLAKRGWERFLPRLSEHHERFFISALMVILGIALLSGIWH